MNPSPVRLLAILGAAALLVTGCETVEPAPPAPPAEPVPAPVTVPARAKPVLSWSVTSRPIDGETLTHDLHLHVDGTRHPIASAIPSLTGAEAHGEYAPKGALTGYEFKWHASGDNFYVREEPHRLAVYRASWGDDEEGATTTILAKAIPRP